MVRLILTILFFPLGLLCILPAPTYFLWQVSVLVTEFPWIFIGIISVLLLWGFAVKKYRVAGNLAGIALLALFLYPVIGACFISPGLDQRFETAFGTKTHMHKNPYSFWRMFSGFSDNKVAYTATNFKTIPYAINTDGIMTMDFYRAAAPGKRPCVIVVHGGSWSGGDSRQLPELNGYLSGRGYNVASINYRLAPKYTYPAQIDDVHAAFDFLRAHAAELGVDTGNFILLGRSAGGQMVLNVACSQHEPGLKGVIDFYGPTDMVWGYANPANPRVLNTCRIMEDYLGGTYTQVRKNYVASSATETVAVGCVPILMIHGKNDPLVAYEHSTRLSKKLDQYGVKYFLLTLPWATHGCDYTLDGPSGQLSTYVVERFLGYVTINHLK